LSTSRDLKVRLISSSSSRETRSWIWADSVLALAEQYLAFIEQARGLRLEIAADYLVMAAWLLI
jgi:chromatin segregation and condensation protein Rec8/ScpA/Scc1 (kleisin family)